MGCLAQVGKDYHMVRKLRVLSGSLGSKLASVLWQGQGLLSSNLRVVAMSPEASTSPQEQIIRTGGWAVMCGHQRQALDSSLRSF